MVAVGVRVYLFLLLLVVFECLFYVLLYFFFFKQKTAYDMRISDWSSDVCSSDLGGNHAAPGLVREVFQVQRIHRPLEADVQLGYLALGYRFQPEDRKSVV